LDDHLAFRPQAIATRRQARVRRRASAIMRSAPHWRRQDNVLHRAFRRIAFRRRRLAEAAVQFHVSAFLLQQQCAQRDHGCAASPNTMKRCEFVSRRSRHGLALEFSGDQSEVCGNRQQNRHDLVSGLRNMRKIGGTVSGKKPSHREFVVAATWRDPGRVVYSQSIDRADQYAPRPAKFAGAVLIVPA